MPASGWTNFDAAITVCRAQYIPTAERRELLDMLGLLDEDGCSVEPDPDRGAEVGLLETINNNGGSFDVPAKGRMANRIETPSLGGKFCPPGLRKLFEGEPPTPPSPGPEPVAEKPKPKPTKAKMAGVGRGNGRRGLPITHGTPNGPSAHRRRGEEPCEECREARRAYDRDIKRKSYVPKPRRIAACGTAAGRERHRRKKERVCDPCREAHNQNQRDQRAA